MTDKENRGIYIHIPFCEHWCNYCDFFTTGGFEQEKIVQYCSYLIKEVDIFAKSADVRGVNHASSHSDRSRGVEKFNVSSVYIGGGTPSYAPGKSIADIMDKIHGEFNVLENAEITIEVNPRSALQDKLIAYREAGINRLSIGIQSQNAGELKTLERNHSAEEGPETVQTAREAGFDNISVDFMYGTPGQTLKSWEETLDSVRIMEPEHVSAYTLMLEAGTRMTGQVQNGELVLPVDDVTTDMFEIACNRLGSLGYNHYELSNYAKPGFESKHNMHYWERKPYIGFGMSSHAYDGTTRFWNTKSFSKYYETIDNGELPVEGKEILSKIQQMNEVIMLGLRMRSGLSLSCFGEQFGRQPAETLAGKVESILEEDRLSELLLCENDHIRLTAKGLFVSDEVIAKLMVQEDVSEYID